jgi:two-component system nitrate/nitrite sensor histidine kinase NarX
MQTRGQWTLGAKLALVVTPFLLIALASIGVLVWMSLQLEGGAASVNEAGSLRMQAYRLAVSAGVADTQALPQQLAAFDRSLALLRDGDPERPLFVPWDRSVRQRFSAVEQDWQRFRGRLSAAQPPAPAAALAQEAAAFAGHIDDFVAAIENHLSRWTSLMH